MMNNNTEKDTYLKLMDEFPILYQRHKLSMSQTCMCWGIECSYGWYSVIRRLSANLEALNILIGKKYHLAIMAEQVKEKFGGLRFYFNVCDDGRFRLMHILSFPFKLLAWILKKFKKNRISFYEKGGFLFKLYNWTHDVAYFIDHEMLGKNYVRINEIVKNYLDELANFYVEVAEKECYSTCEECGRQIGTLWSPRAETVGWIKYLCHKCAEKGSSRVYHFTKNDDGTNPINPADDQEIDDTIEFIGKEKCINQNEQKHD